MRNRTKQRTNNGENTELQAKSNPNSETPTHRKASYKLNEILYCGTLQNCLLQFQLKSHSEVT